jgi:hypothetical protein
MTTSSIQYLVLPDVRSPFLLARVRWPDVAQAISPANLEWQDDPGLFDLPYDPSSVAISAEHASAIAEGWGASLPAGGEASAWTRSIIRRMPPNWSSPSPAEVYQWSLDLARPAGPRGHASFPSAEARTRRFASLLRAGDRSNVANDEAEHEKVDRRREPRVRIRSLAEIGFGTAHLPAELLDLAGGGARLFLRHCSAVLDVGRTLDPLVLIDSNGTIATKRLELSGTVEWRSDSREGSDFGVSFRSLRTAQSDGVRLLVAHGSDTGESRA